MNIKLSNIEINDQDTSTFIINNLALFNQINNQLTSNNWSLIKINHDSLVTFQFTNRCSDQDGLSQFVTTDFQQINNQVKIFNWLKDWQAKLNKLNYHASKQHLQIVYRTQTLTYLFNFTNVDSLIKMNYYCLIAWLFIDAKTSISEVLNQAFNMQDNITDNFIISITNDSITASIDGFQKSFTNQAFAKILSNQHWLTNYLANQDQQLLNNFVNFLTNSSWMGPKDLAIQLLDLYFKNPTFLIENQCYYQNHNFQVPIKNATIKFANPKYLLIDNNRQFDQSTISQFNQLANILRQHLDSLTITFCLNETKTFNILIEHIKPITNRYEKIVGEELAQYRLLIKSISILNVPYHINLKRLKTNFKSICWLINNVKDISLCQLHYSEKINYLPKVFYYWKTGRWYRERHWYKCYFNDVDAKYLVREINDNYSFNLSIVDGFVLLTSVEKSDKITNKQSSYLLETITNAPALKKQLQKIKPWK